MTNHWTDLIELEDLSDDLRYIAECCDIETVRKLIKKVSGMTFYVPKSPPKTTVQRLIDSDFDGSRNCGREISRRLNISEQSFYSILNSRRVGN